MSHTDPTLTAEFERALAERGPTKTVITTHAFEGTVSCLECEAGPDRLYVRKTHSDAGIMRELICKECGVFETLPQ